VQGVGVSPWFGRRGGSVYRTVCMGTRPSARGFAAACPLLDHWHWLWHSLAAADELCLGWLAWATTGVREVCLLLLVVNMRSRCGLFIAS
jgi:hypothetical protein